MGLTLMMRRELLRLDRAGGRRRLVRVVTLVLLSFVLLFSHGYGARVPFLALVIALFQMLLFMQPVRAAGILVQGRLEGTLQLLGTTPLRPWAILAGTCSAALALAGEGLLVSLPLVSIAAAYGGMEPALVARAYLALGGAAVLGTAIGAWVGAQGDRLSSGAFLRSLAWTLLFVLGPGALWALADAAKWKEGGKFFAQLWLPVALSPDLDLRHAIIPVSFSLLLSLGLFLLGVRRLSRTVLCGDARPQAHAARTRSKRRDWRILALPPLHWIRAWRERRARVPSSWILAWRERRRVDPRHWISPGFLALAAVLILFGISIAGMIDKGQADGAFAFLLTLCFTLWQLGLAWGLLTGARSYVEDREDGSLELLLTTTLTHKRIVLEKLIGALSRGAFGVLFGATFHAFAIGYYVLFYNEGENAVALAIGSALATVLLWSTGVLLSTALGQFYSVVAPTSTRAQAWAAMTAGGLVFGGLFFSCMFHLPLVMMAKEHAGVGELIGYVALSFACVLLAAMFVNLVHGHVPQLAGSAPLHLPSSGNEGGTLGAGKYLPS